MGVVSEDLAPPCSAVATIVFPLVLPCSSVSSDPLDDRGSGILGLGALSSIKALSSPSASDERSRFSARGSMSFSLLASVLSVCYVLLVDGTKCYHPRLSWSYLQQVTKGFLTITSSFSQ